MIGVGLIVVVLAAVMVVAVIEAVRRRRLSEGWALLWITVAVAAVVLAMARPLVDRLATRLDVAYGTSLVFAIGIVFLVVVCINLSMQVSRLNQRVERLAQELALATEQRTGDGIAEQAPESPDDPGSSPG